MLINTWVLALSILGSSFIGSWHCAGMCGPMASLIAHKGSLKNYHLGRAFGYTTLGILAGWIGQFFLQSDFYWLRMISGLLMFTTLMWMGLNLFFAGKTLPLPKVTFFNRWTQKKSSSFTLGMLSLFLPCGWLYTYVLAAAASQSPASGFLVMLLFWLGTLPALSIFPVFLSKTISLSQSRKQKVAGLILFVASFYSLFSFYFLHAL